MGDQTTVKTKRGSILQVNLNLKGDLHVFDRKGFLVQRYEDFDTASMAIWLLNKNAEDGPFSMKVIKG